MITSTLRSVIRFVAKTKAVDIEKFSELSYLNLTNVRSIHITSNVLKNIRIENKKRRIPSTSRSDAVEGENSFSINAERK